jgi:hypothetical protein
MSVWRERAPRDAPGAPHEKGGAERRTDVSHFAHFLMAQELLELSGRHARYEAISSKPGIGEKVTAALRGLRFRATLGTVEPPALPALLDYPFRS